MSRVFMPTIARLVQVGDDVDVMGTRVNVTDVFRGANRQTYISGVTAGGAPVCVERDPGEAVSVWRERPEVPTEFAGNQGLTL